MRLPITMTPSSAPRCWRAPREGWSTCCRDESVGRFQSSSKGGVLPSPCPAVAARGAQPRYFQPGLPPAGPAGVRGRIPPVHGRLRQSHGLELRGGEAVDGKPCAVASSVAGKAPRCTWSTSGQRRRECAWLSAKLPAATRQRGRWKSWACWTSKAVSLPRMHCTAIATLPPRCSSGVRITCWRSRRTRASCSLRPLGAMRAAEPAALPNGANPPHPLLPPSPALPHKGGRPSLPHELSRFRSAARSIVPRREALRAAREL